MTTSEFGRKLIESFEGLRLTAYLDQRGIPTLGYGHTLGVKMGQACTRDEADAWLAGDLATAEAAVREIVKVPVSQNQYDALVSLCYNIGAGAFRESTLGKLLNEGDVLGASMQFLAWCRPGGVVNDGLLSRRKRERMMVDTGQPILTYGQEPAGAGPNIVSFTAQHDSTGQYVVFTVADTNSYYHWISGLTVFRGNTLTVPVASVAQLGGTATLVSRNQYATSTKSAVIQ